MICWHRYDTGRPIRRGGVVRGMLRIQVRKECQKCGKVKEYWTSAVWIDS